MEPLETILLVAGAGVATGWAAWVSKTLITILSTLQGTAGRVAMLEKGHADHELRLRNEGM